MIPMRATLPILALACLLPACTVGRPATAAAPPAGAKTVRLCAAVEGRLRELAGWIDAVTGDTLVAGRRFRETFPAEHAAGRPWFERGEMLPVVPGRYRAVGVPRALSERERAKGLEVAHRVDGVDVFATLPRHEDQRRAEASGDDSSLWSPEDLYVPVGAGCLFQQYHDPSDIGSVPG